MRWYCMDNAGRQNPPALRTPRSFRVHGIYPRRAVPGHHRLRPSMTATVRQHWKKTFSTKKLATTRVMPALGRAWNCPNCATLTVTLTIPASSLRALWLQGRRRLTSLLEPPSRTLTQASSMLVSIYPATYSIQCHSCSAAATSVLFPSPVVFDIHRKIQQKFTTPPNKTSSALVRAGTVVRIPP